MRACVHACVLQRVCVCVSVSVSVSVSMCVYVHGVLFLISACLCMSQRAECLNLFILHSLLPSAFNSFLIICLLSLCVSQ